MTKKIYILLIIFSLFNLHSYSQDTTKIENLSVIPQKNIIKINCPALLTTTINIGYERILNKNLSLQVQGFILTFPFFDFVTGGRSYYGFSAEIRYYPRKSAPNKFFIAPYFRYNHHKSYTSNNYEGTDYYTTDLYQIGIRVGKQWVFNNHITLDIYGGIGCGYTIDDISIYKYRLTKVTHDHYEGFRPTIPLGATVGYAF